MAKRSITAKAVPPIRPASGTFISDRFRGSGGALSYRLYTPIGSPRRRLPLLVMLHGCTQSASDFASGTGMNEVADELGFLVLYPEQSASANMARCWNWHRPANQRRGSGEPATIAALTRHVLRFCKGNPARVYIAGISAGGAAAAIIAAAYPELYVAVGVHSGLSGGTISSLTEARLAMRRGPGPNPAGALGKFAQPLPTIVFHGDRDSTVHPSNANGFVDRLRQSNRGALAVQTFIGRSPRGRDFTRTTYRQRAGNVLLETWVVHGSGHAWAGGKAFGSYTDATGPDASREMARFFLARKRTI
ncbi:PHB depolymerase family esterase [Bosea sp. BIWAKO-01]|uniref:extracellular catalytic domain type 1 short-chain-length polyhydroxyalkanoate depolymerase n=1 Tax=Bosea sp. BIWAKO-01 TaxID=506668 RepID=UPI00191C870A|nr:PHB depolymerase family esterase [Bosea sp. BIWAKO-01]